MSCTIYYKGTLKDSYSESDVFSTITQHLQKMSAKLYQEDTSIVIHFLQGKSETLVFDFKDRKIDGTFKWNGENKEEFYEVLDLFITLKSLFKSLKVDDDDDIWNEHLAQKSECKIKLRELSFEEQAVLKRIEINSKNPMNDLEYHIFKKSNFAPYYKNLLRIIIDDFIKIMNYNNVDDFNEQKIIDEAIKTNYFSENMSFVFTLKNFDFYFCTMIVIIWISNTCEYKKLGCIKDLDNNERGLASSKIAMSEGLESIFLNKHTGGASNSKAAEMRKLAKKHYKTWEMGAIMVIDKPEIELQFLFSMMDYLGFSYIGVKYVV